MAVTFKSILLFCFLIPLFTLSSAQTCTSVTFPSNRLFTSCNNLPLLSASIHWNYNPTAGTVDIAYRALQSSDGWISWAVNPTGTGMVGCQALVAVLSNGNLTARTTQITSYGPSMTQQTLTFGVSNLTATSENGALTIFATVTLPNNRTSVNHVWQAGPVSNGAIGQHALTGANVQSMGTLDFSSGQTTSSGGGNSRIRRRNVHGVLNAVSWGTLMPLGAIIARYLRVFKSADPAWFYLHVACQCSAYIVGVAGWGTGLKLGSESSGIEYNSHRNIGIALFCLGTLQLFALLLRPKKDHKYRLYWNIYHHSVGYTVISLSIVNIFKGFDILDPEKKWKHTYIGIIATLGGIAVVLEAITWGIVLKRKSRGSDKSHHGTNGVNGYGGRQNQGV
eukprot:TRINITY_DN5133_c0_g1_i1.p1 TRINITY_DN5133_c0_g1~~TRINITY_DN5133_c0_g1_i1.p1  ORF type:complete len:393 (-),score=25.82 TRINITY_DN5133_c0_g1_i1:182-1360(-)